MHLSSFLKKIETEKAREVHLGKNSHISQMWKKVMKLKELYAMGPLQDLVT